MTLIILLAALYLQWFMNQRLSLDDFDWFTPYVTFLHDKLSSYDVMQGYYGLTILILPIVLAIALVSMIVDHWLFGLFELVFGFMVFFYCAKAVDPATELASYFKGNKAEKEVKAFIDGPMPKTDGGIARKVTNTLLTHSLQQIFSMIFWFVLLGPLGVTIYFMVSLVGQSKVSETKPMHDAAHTVLAVMDWLPVRLVGLSFALMGSFGSVIVSWLKSLKPALDSASELACQFGLLANGANPRDSKEATYKEAIEARELVFRSVIVWLVVIGLLTVASWF